MSNLLQHFRRDATDEWYWRESYHAGMDNSVTLDFAGTAFDKTFAPPIGRVGTYVLQVSWRPRLFSRGDWYGEVLHVSRQQGWPLESCSIRIRCRAQSPDQAMVKLREKCRQDLQDRLESYG